MCVKPRRQGKAEQLFVDVFFSSGSNHRVRAVHRFLKADVLHESKYRHAYGSWAVGSTIKVDRSQSSFTYSEAEIADLGMGKTRSKATYPHSTDEDNNQPRHMIPTNYNSSTSRRVEVEPTFSGLPPIDNVCVYTQCAFMSLCHVTQLICAAV